MVVSGVIWIRHAKSRLPVTCNLYELGLAEAGALGLSTSASSIPDGEVVQKARIVSSARSSSDASSPPPAFSKENLPSYLSVHISVFLI